MFDLDKWAEIFATIKKNKLRTFLTGFSVSWGIFMFCILLSSGNGLKNGMMSNFGSRSVNSLEYWGRRTSMPHKGFPERRRINLDEKDIVHIKNRVPEASNITPIIDNNLNVSYGINNTSSKVVGVTPDYPKTNGITIKDNQGRFINDLDIRDKRKVAVINSRFCEVLFKDEPPIGKLFIANGLSYTVIGVFEEDSWEDSEKAYIPLTTAQALYQGGYGYDDIVFTLSGLETEKENESFEERFRIEMAGLHHFNPEDKRAIGIWNQLQNYLQFIGIFNGISTFIWIIGVGTLIAGIISVSNIMLITVRERTREIGIRKALGAKPSSILASILMESVFITAVFGYVGMFLGVGLGELVSSILETPGMEEVSQVFKSPTIDVNVAIGAMLILMTSGLIAGYFPAMKAVKIPPVEAMRTE
ncbi:ABC transporter permease [Bacteroidales bacterium OttesenSCG-928-M11]|nr:ABC transporter permease [Bacteroidales bacterium OttesenSCG-928-M11]